uniref:Uncharacterized protein n=1 Tax=Arundo donax TaxID=35708 RepID=A0A0A9DIN6_ARUDO
MPLQGGGKDRLARQFDKDGAMEAKAKPVGASARTTHTHSPPPPITFSCAPCVVYLDLGLGREERQGRHAASRRCLCLNPFPPLAPSQREPPASRRLCAGIVPSLLPRRSHPRQLRGGSRGSGIDAKIGEEDLLTTGRIGCRR